jgi:hypothetical protein
MNSKDRVKEGLTAVLSLHVECRSGGAGLQAVALAPGISNAGKR